MEEEKLWGIILTSLVAISGFIVAIVGIITPTRASITLAKIRHNNEMEKQLELRKFKMYEAAISQLAERVKFYEQIIGLFSADVELKPFYLVRSIYLESIVGLLNIETTSLCRMTLFTECQLRHDYSPLVTTLQVFTHELRGLDEERIKEPQWLKDEKPIMLQKIKDIIPIFELRKMEFVDCSNQLKEELFSSGIMKSLFNVSYISLKDISMKCKE